jgi:hypothetical protein
LIEVGKVGDSDTVAVVFLPEQGPFTAVGGLCDEGRMLNESCRQRCEQEEIINND